jgi:hypothetical protein
MGRAWRQGRFPSVANLMISVTRCDSAGTVRPLSAKKGRKAYAFWELALGSTATLAVPPLNHCLLVAALSRCVPTPALDGAGETRDGKSK